MKYLFRFITKLFGISILISAIAVIWYRQLPPRRKQFVQNFIRQIPDLPARYQV